MTRAIDSSDCAVMTKKPIKSLLIATDAWKPQLNGVVRTYEYLIQQLESQGIQVSLVEPSQFYTVPLPGYQEIRLSIVFALQLNRLIQTLNPDKIHIATEGPIGMAVRRYCLRHSLPFSTSFHTKFPEYLEARTLIPSDFSYYFIRQFHEPSRAVFIATESLKKTLTQKGFKNLYLWPKAVDLALFRPKALNKAEFLAQNKVFAGSAGAAPVGSSPAVTALTASNPSAQTTTEPKIYLYVGRVAVEKNLEAFLSLPLDGIKIVVGDGPAREDLEKTYPEVRFLGRKDGEDLVDWYNCADVFVFPSLTDTYGNVVLEALACGVPVAAFPVTGPIDIIENNKTGCLNWDLTVAIERALKLDRRTCRLSAEKNSWDHVTQAFIDILQKAY